MQHFNSTSISSGFSFKRARPLGHLVPAGDWLSYNSDIKTWNKFVTIVI